MKVLAIKALLLAILLCGSIEVTNADTLEDVEAAVEGWAEAYNSHNPE